MLGGHAAIATHKTMLRLVWDRTPIPIVASARAGSALAAPRNGDHDAAPPPVSLPSGADALKRALDTPGQEIGKLANQAWMRSAMLWRVATAAVRLVSGRPPCTGS